MHRDSTLRPGVARSELGSRIATKEHRERKENTWCFSSLSSLRSFLASFAISWRIPDFLGLSPRCRAVAVGHFRLSEFSHAFLLALEFCLPSPVFRLLSPVLPCAALSAI